jgi:hypothetical protein
LVSYCRQSQSLPRVVASPPSRDLGHVNVNGVRGVEVEVGGVLQLALVAEDHRVNRYRANGLLKDHESQGSMVHCTPKHGFVLCIINTFFFEYCILYNIRIIWAPGS